MMKKTLFLMSVLTLSLFLIACTPAPEPTDEEIQAELAQLSDQQLETLKEGKQPLAGQAYASILQQTRRQRLLASVNREIDRRRIYLRLEVGAACTQLGSDIPPARTLRGTESACRSELCFNYSIRSYDDPDIAETLNSWGCAEPAPDMISSVGCCIPTYVGSYDRCVLNEQCHNSLRCSRDSTCLQ